MQRSQSWKINWDSLNAYNKRNIYEQEPEVPPPYDEDAPEFSWEHHPSSKPENLCSNCVTAILKIYSNRNGTNTFGLFLPAARTCILCRLMAEIQDASTLDHEQRVLEMMKHRVPFPDLSRAPPAHMKDLVILWSQLSDSELELGASVITQSFDEAGLRAIPKDRLDPSIVRAWLTDCEENHGEKCCGALSRQTGTQHKIWLIDTRHFCLVQKTLPTRYVALSYVWGKVQTFRLQEKDIPALCDLEGLRDIEDRLPEAILNAIEFVRSIGESFLWVDAVCIPQDNAKEMERQIGHMASVYRTAVLTLVAVSSADASSALPGIRPGTRKLRAFLETPDFTLSERQASILPVLLGSKYHTRAWTFQERLLSTRCLYFTKEQIFLQCQSGIFREDRLAYIPFKRLGRDVLALKPLSPEYIEANSSTGLTGLAKYHQLYKQIVEEYTTKSLSFEADILHAFTGVAEELHPLIQSPLVAAMPEKFFFRSMLFQPKGSTFTKRTAEMKHLDKRENEVLSLQFPSWSWCGWVGAVEYKNVGSIIAHSGRIQICTSARGTAKQEPARWQFLETSIEPQSHGYDLDITSATATKAMPDLRPFTIRFIADVDVANSFKLETSPRGENYLSVTGPNGLQCGLIRLDDPRHGRKQSVNSTVAKPKLLRKDTRGPGLILLCDIEQDLVQRSDDDISAKSKTWGPKLYYNGSPWKLCAVLYVQWHGGTAERLGIGELVKDDWQRANTSTQLVYLI